MILDKEVKLSISSKNIEHYLELGYKIKNCDKITVPIEHLTEGSNVIINVQCDICEKKYTIKYYRYLENYNKYQIFTCQKCNVVKREKTCLTLYGETNVSKIENVKSKRKKTMTERFGVEHALQSKELKEKSHQTNLNNHNGKYSSTIDEIKEKSINTSIERYGEKYPNQTDEIKKKISKNLKKVLKLKTLDKYKKINIIETGETDYTFLCDCSENHEFKINKHLLYNRMKLGTKLCTICNSVDSQISGRQLMIFDAVKEIYSKEIILNDRKTIYPKHLDLYLPDLKIAIEFNGTYWHSEVYRDENYHKNKYLICKSKGIRLFQIWEYDWLHKQDIIKSLLQELILRKLKIKKYKIKILPNDTSIEFFKLNSLKIPVTVKKSFGFFENNELLSVMSATEDNEIFYCNKIFKNIDSFDILLQKFTKNNILHYKINNSYDNSSILNDKFILDYQINPIRICVDFSKNKTTDFVENNNNLGFLYDAGETVYSIKNKF